MLGAWGGGTQSRGGGPILGAEHPIRGPQGLHISRVPRSILSRGDPRWGDRSILSHVGGSMSQGHSVHPFEAAPIPRARGILEAAYEPRGCTPGLLRGHTYPNGQPRTSYPGRLSHGVHAPSNPGAAVLHTHCSHLSGSRCGTFGGWRHPIDLGTGSLTNASFQLSVETARRQRRACRLLGRM